MVVPVAVRNTRPVNQHRVVQQRSLVLFDRLHLLQNIRQLLDVERIDILQLLRLKRLAPDVR